MSNQTQNGLRGVSIEDVDAVARGGSTAMNIPDPRRGGLPTYRRNPVLNLNAEEIIKGMTSIPLNTAGERYSGYPTASAQKAAILGSIEPFYALGDYARQLAAQEAGDIVSAIERPYGAGADFAITQGPIAIPGVGQGGFVDVAAGNELDPRVQAAQLAANKAYVELGIGKLLGQDVSREAVDRAQADLALATRNATTGRLAEATGAAARGAETYESTVVPAAQFAEDVFSTPRYELARQMATQYFGMDPALAAGTFTPQVDIDYLDMMQDLKSAQNLARGIDPSETVAETLLRRDPTGRELQEYQNDLADQAIIKANEGLNSAAEDEVDAQIANDLGISVETAAGDLPRSTARYYLTQFDFQDTVNAYIKQMTDMRDLGTETPKEYISRLVRNYVNDGGAPIAAIILENILLSFEFLPGEL